MFLDLLILYARIVLLSTPLFIAIFFFTWWMRGRGFGEWVAFLQRLRLWRRPRASIAPPRRDAETEAEPR